jgi:hypothetical protein
LLLSSHAYLSLLYPQRTVVVIAHIKVVRERSLLLVLLILLLLLLLIRAYITRLSLAHSSNNWAVKLSLAGFLRTETPCFLWLRPLCTQLHLPLLYLRRPSLLVRSPHLLSRGRRVSDQ